MITDMLMQIPDFPQAAQDSYPLLITFIVYTGFLLGGFLALARFAFTTIKGVADNFVKSLERLLVTQREQTDLLLDIHDAVIDDHNDKKRTRRNSNKRGV